MNDSKNKEQYQKGLLKASAFELPLVILLVIGFIKYTSGTLGLAFIAIMLIAGLIKLVATFLFCREQLGLPATVGMGVSGLVYTLMFALLYYMV